MLKYRYTAAVLAANFLLAGPFALAESPAPDSEPRNRFELIRSSGAKLGPFDLTNGNTIEIGRAKFTLLTTDQKDFTLKYDSTGKQYGPFQFEDNAQVVIGKAVFDVAVVERKDSAIKKTAKGVWGLGKVIVQGAGVLASNVVDVVQEAAVESSEPEKPASTPDGDKEEPYQPFRHGSRKSPRETSPVKPDPGPAVVAQKTVRNSSGAEPASGSQIAEPEPEETPERPKPVLSDATGSQAGSGDSINNEEEADRNTPKAVTPAQVEKDDRAPNAVEASIDDKPDPDSGSNLIESQQDASTSASVENDNYIVMKLPKIGAAVQNADKDLFQYGKMQVSLVEDGFPAAAGGLRVGDVISSIDMSRIDTSMDFLAKVLSMNPGEKYEIKIHRDGNYHPITVSPNLVDHSYPYRTTLVKSDSGSNERLSNKIATGSTRFGGYGRAVTCYTAFVKAFQDIGRRASYVDNMTEAMKKVDGEIAGLIGSFHLRHSWEKDPYPKQNYALYSDYVIKYLRHLIGLDQRGEWTMTDWEVRAVWRVLTEYYEPNYAYAYEDLGSLIETIQTRHDAFLAKVEEERKSRELRHKSMGLTLKRVTLENAWETKLATFERRRYERETGVIDDFGNNSRLTVTRDIEGSIDAHMNEIKLLLDEAGGPFVGVGQARNALLSMFYDLRDMTHDQPDHREAKVWSALNLKVYQELCAPRIEAALVIYSEQREIPRTVIPLCDLVMEYYVPNFSDFENVAELASKAAKLKKSYPELRDEELNRLRVKYLYEKGGWKYLKWGMSLEEVGILIKAHKPDASFKRERSKTLCIDEHLTMLDDDGLEIYAVDDTDFYFYEGKLMGRMTVMKGAKYGEHGESIRQKLKEQYPGGEIRGVKPMDSALNRFHMQARATNERELKQAQRNVKAQKDVSVPIFYNLDEHNYVFIAVMTHMLGPHVMVHYYDPDGLEAHIRRLAAAEEETHKAEEAKVLDDI